MRCLRFGDITYYTILVPDVYKDIQLMLVYLYGRLEKKLINADLSFTIILDPSFYIISFSV